MKEGPWSRINSRERTHILLRFAEYIRNDAEALAQLETKNVGKPIRESRDEGCPCRRLFRILMQARSTR